MRRKESAIISSSLQSLQLWSGKQHPGHAVRHRDFALLLQRVREQEGLTKEGNEATYLLGYCRFLYLQAAGGLHQSVHQIFTSTHLHTCSNCVCVYVSLEWFSAPFHTPYVGLSFCMRITLPTDGCGTWSEKKGNKIISFLSKKVYEIHS